MNLLERIEAQSSPEPNSGCLLWMGSANRTGYGFMSRPTGSRLVHRIYYELVKGPIPVGMVLCHKCDVPACINPTHLFLGTHNDNMADMARKGRSRNGPGGVAYGSANAMARLTVADVIAIRADDRTLAAIARSYGVSLSCIDHVKSRRNWRHI